MEWLVLILSLPSATTAARQRAWRALKGAGAAVLRDGAYLLPARADCRVLLDQVAADVLAHGGTAQVLEVRDSPAAPLAARFDRTTQFDALIATLEALPPPGSAAAIAEARRCVRRLRRQFDALAATDYFPGPAQQAAARRLEQIEQQLARADAADEPQPRARSAKTCHRADFQARTWATRRRPWVDRLACAWLILRHIDGNARFLWLANPADCPPDAVGFDFDGATFSHAGDHVSFETLLASFSLDAPALRRLAQLVHHLDVGGTATDEAAGVEAVLGGLRQLQADDDALLAAALPVFDALQARFTA